MKSVTKFAKEAKNAVITEDNVVAFRKAKAVLLHELGEKWAENTIEIGRELVAVRDTFPQRHPSNHRSPRPGWHDWIKTDCEFERSHTNQFIRIYEKFGVAGLPGIKSSELLGYLSRDTVPDDVREEIVKRIKGGEIIGKRKAVGIVKERTTPQIPKPSKARKIARDTGVPTQASDGNIYFGATEKQEVEINKRIEIVGGIRNAIERIAEVEMTAEEFLEYALPHQLWKHDEVDQIHDASNWLNDLMKAWKDR